MVSIFLRSLLFNILFYVVFVFCALVALPTLVMPRTAVLRVANWWAQITIVLMRVICNIKVEYRGVEKIPKGPLIIAAKHQSIWETIALLHFFAQPFFVLKRELLRIPVFGQYLMKANMIAIDRSSGTKALKQVVRRAGEEVKRGRQFLIFPEGTRRPIGAPPEYKAGVSLIYADCGAPCLPVALNSGLFWPRRTFLRYPGTLVVEFLDPLPPGLPRAEFLTRVENMIEDASNRLIAAGQAEQAALFGRVPQGPKL